LQQKNAVTKWINASVELELKRSRHRLIKISNSRN